MVSEQWNTEADGPEKRELANRLAERLRQMYAVGRRRAPRSGQVVPGRAAAALEHRAAVAHRRRAALEGPGTVGRPLVDGRGPGRRARPRGGAGPAGHVGARAAGGAAAGGLRGPARRDRRGRRPPGGPAARRARPRRGRGRQARCRGHRTDRVGAAGRHRPRTGGPARSGGSAAAAWCSPAGPAPSGCGCPLDSIAWEDPEFAGEPSYLEAGPPLEPKVPVVTICDPEGAPTTALTFEARDGHVHVFLPPTERLEDYADLLAAHRGGGPQARHPRGDRGLRPAAGPAADPTRRHPGPGCHRGQRPADAELGRAARPDDDALRCRPRRGADHREVRPRRVCTPAPAAATT